MSPPIYTPDGSEVSEIVLPDGSTASEVIGPDGNVVFEAGPDIPDNGVSRYTFDNKDTSNGTALDVWNNNDATINGATTGVSGIAGYDSGEAYSFDGTDDFVETPDLPVDTEVSVAFWIDADSTGHDRPVFGFNSNFFGSGADATFTFRFDTEGFESGDSECFNVAVNSTFNETEANVTSTNVMHIVVTYSAGNLPRVYKNGSELTFATSNTPSGGIGTDSDGFYVGRGPDPDEYTQGVVDDPRVYDKELTPTEVSNLFNTGSI